MDSEEMKRRVQQRQAFAEGVTGFFRLLRRLDFNWSDLIRGLGHRGLVSEAATIRHHQALGVALQQFGVISDCAFWEGVLRGRGIASDFAVTEHCQPTPPVAERPI